MRCGAIVALFAGLAIASPLRARTAYQVKERHSAPVKWSKGGLAPKDHVIHLNIGLKSSQFAELERQLYEVSDPDHHRYGQHMSAVEVNKLVEPKAETLELVHEWLAENGIHAESLSYSAARDWVKVSLPVSAVEQLLDCSYSVFDHPEGDRLYRTNEWSLPKHLHKHIDAIQPTTSFFRSSPLGRAVKPVTAIPGDAAVPMVSNTETVIDTPESISKACNFSAITPKCLRNLYGTIDYKPQAMGENLIGINNFLNETSNRSDVHLFLQQFRPAATKYAFEYPINIVANGPDQQTPNTPDENTAGHDLEGNLDAEYVIGITYPSPIEEFNTGGSPPFIVDDNTPTDTNEPYLTWLQYFLAQDRIPQTVSTSYGDDEQSVPVAYAEKVCQQFAQVGARGTTLLFASGDSGVGSNGTCFSNDGKNRHTFLPSFPPSCPYVTAVGGTMEFPEVAAYDPRNGFASGGGFSYYFPRPAYQNKAVESYLARIGDLYAGLFSPTGRAYPDVSAQSVSFLVTWGGINVLLDGTSCATPTTSSVISLVNDALLAAGKPTLGFMNPWLYKTGNTAFTDVTVGSAIGCNRAGFPALPGWDAVTGFGTPNFGSIVALLGV